MVYGVLFLDVLRSIDGSVTARIDVVGVAGTWDVDRVNAAPQFYTVISLIRN